MNEVSSTVFFNGQFWIAIIQKIDCDGMVRIGNYTFGSEPTNNDLKNFYLYIYPSLPCMRSEVKIRVKEKRTIHEQTRIACKSREVYKEIQKSIFTMNKKQKKYVKLENEKARFEKKLKKRKEKKKGH